MTHQIRWSGDLRSRQCAHATHSEAIKCAVLAPDAAPGNCRRCGAALAAHVTATIRLTGIDVIARCSGAVRYAAERRARPYA